MLDRIGSPALAQGQGLSELRKSHGIYSNAPGVSVQRMPQTNIGDRRNDVPPKPYPFAEMVLGDFSDGDVFQGNLDAQPPKASGNQNLPSGVVDGAQDTAGDGSAGRVVQTERKSPSGSD